MKQQSRNSTKVVVLVQIQAGSCYEKSKESSSFGISRKDQAIRNLRQKIGSEKADYYRGHSDVDPALEAECKKKFDEILKLLY